MAEIANKFAPRGVDYFIVYITEAHPTDGWMPEWAQGPFTSIAHAKSTEMRLQAARTFVKELGLSVPVLVDSIKDELENRYEARPERLYVVQRGKVLWRCHLGPFFYDVPALATFLEQHTA